MASQITPLLIVDSQLENGNDSDHSMHDKEVD